MADLDPAVLGQKAETMIRARATISAEEGRITRLYLTPQHRRAADLVGQWMQEAGLTVSAAAGAASWPPAVTCTVAVAVVESPAVSVTVTVTV